MSEKDIKTEVRILEAAVEEFVSKGKSGARMQAIADKAGINKALLHYYYRSKDTLFESVFVGVIRKLVLPRMLVVINQENDLFELIRKFTHAYLNVLNNNPSIAFFILEEITKNPTRMSDAIIRSELPMERLFGIVKKAVSDGVIRPIDPPQLMVNIVALCVFPLVGRNMMQPVLFDGDERAYCEFLEARKEEVAEFIILSLTNTS